MPATEADEEHRTESSDTSALVEGKPAKKRPGTVRILTRPKNTEATPAPVVVEESAVDRPISESTRSTRNEETLPRVYSNPQLNTSNENREQVQPMSFTNFRPGNVSHETAQHRQQKMRLDPQFQGHHQAGGGGAGVGFGQQQQSGGSFGQSSTGGGGVSFGHQRVGFGQQVANGFGHHRQWSRHQIPVPLQLHSTAQPPPPPAPYQGYQQQQSHSYQVQTQWRQDSMGLWHQVVNNPGYGPPHPPPVMISPSPTQGLFPPQNQQYGSFPSAQSSPTYPSQPHAQGYQQNQTPWPTASSSSFPPAPMPYYSAPQSEDPFDALAHRIENVELQDRDYPPRNNKKNRRGGRGQHQRQPSVVPNDVSGSGRGSGGHGRGKSMKQ